MRFQMVPRPVGTYPGLVLGSFIAISACALNARSALLVTHGREIRRADGPEVEVSSRVGLQLQL